MRVVVPKVSIVVPNYNHARFLRQRIETILAQTYENYELILLDDCSKDNSREILMSYLSDPRVRVDFNTANSGSPFKQWNKGVRLAQGDYVWIAESDDYADIGLLKRLLSVLETDHAVAFAYCRSLQVNEDGVVQGLLDEYLNAMSGMRWNFDFIANGREECSRYLVMTNSVPNASAVVFRKTAYECVGGADESYRICGDWKLWSELALRAKIAYIADPLNYFRCHQGTVRVAGDRERWGANEPLRLRRWLLERIEPTEEAMAEARKHSASLLVPALMSPHVPIRLKLMMLRDARAIDPHLLNSAVKPFVTTLKLKFIKHWRLFRQVVNPMA